MMKLKNRGQAIVEFALILPILIVLVMGILEFGLFFHSYVNISFASKEAARLAALDANATSQSIAASVQATMPAARNVAITLTPAAPRTTGLPVTVSVSTQHTFMMPLISVLMPSNPYTISSSTTARSE
ncbi:MAG: TadE family protein [Negativicutes bacterium]